MGEMLTEYRSYMFDSTRWQEVALRPGDIVISTPPKCGTTWLQMICALLVLQTPDLPAPLGTLSPFVDVQTRPLAKLVALLKDQQRRRFMKSHTPLDGLPYDERVTYVTIGRDPRDVAISRVNHDRNVDHEFMRTHREVSTGPADPDLVEEASFTGSTQERFWQWMELQDPFHGLGATLRHLASFWQVRDRSNIVVLHYDDLINDLEGQMRALAARLGIDVPEAKWAELVLAARFDNMRAQSSKLAPGFGMFRDPSQFFQRGSSQQWRDLLDEAGLRRYAAMVSELTDPDLAAWLHRNPQIPA